MSMQPSNAITLPSGWSVATYRETSQANAAGQIVQGMNFTLQGPTGAGTTVFVPNSLLTQTAAIESAFNQRIGAIQAITG